MVPYPVPVRVLLFPDLIRNFLSPCGIRIHNHFHTRTYKNLPFKATFHSNFFIHIDCRDLLLFFLNFTSATFFLSLTCILCISYLAIPAIWHYIELELVFDSGFYSEAVAFLLSFHLATDGGGGETSPLQYESNNTSVADADSTEGGGNDDIIVKIETPPEDLLHHKSESLGNSLHEGRNGYRNNSPECENGRVSSHVTKKIFSCSRCGLCLSSKKDLRQHRKEAHGPRTITTGEGGVPKAQALLAVSLPPAESAADAKTAFQCEFCAKSFGSTSGLSKHLKIHSGLKPFKCEVCEKSFLHSAHLKNHARIHTGEKPYQVCGNTVLGSE